MPLLTIPLAAYFLISLRSLVQDMLDGVATTNTYVQALIAVAIIAGCLASPWFMKKSGGV